MNTKDAQQRRVAAKSIFGSIQQKSLEAMIKRELVLNYGYSDKLKIAEVLAQTVVTIFEDFAPEKERLKPFQLLWMGIDRYDPPGQGKRIENTAQRTVVLTLWDKSELEALASGVRPRDLLPGRVARVTKEALAQDALLIQTDLALIFGCSVATIRKAIDSWSKQAGEILPLRGVIHDIGMTFSHKRQIVSLHLEGYFTSEIGRKTAHDPVNVDRYIQDFERVLEFARERSPIERIAFYTGLSHSLIKEYLEIIAEHSLAELDYLHKVLSNELKSSWEPGHFKEQMKQEANENEQPQGEVDSQE
jgi:hypothetical protein